MSLYLTVLSFHILSAFIIFALIGVSIFALFAKQNLIGKFAKYLALSSFLQVLSGSFLMFLSNNGDVFSFCKNISIYLSLVFIMESILLKKSNNLEFPKKFVYSTSILSLVITVCTAFLFIK